MSKELIAWARELSENRKIDFNNVLEAVEEALAVSVRRMYEGERIFRVELDAESGAQKVYRQWKVVDDVQFPTKEISLEAALIDDPNVKVGDFIEDLEDIDEIKHDRISFITFRQMITSKIREFEKRKIAQSYTPYLGKIVLGTVRRAANTQISVTLPELNPDVNTDIALNDSNSIEGIIDRKNLIYGERWRANEPIRALLVSIEEDPVKGPQITLSRAHNDFLLKLLEREVPEIEKGFVKVMGIARQPGIRSKVLISTDDKRIDAVGACIGVRSQRINAISRELNGERIDIIPYSEDFPTLVKNALAQPAIEEIVIDEAKRIVDVSIPQEFLSGAIGKRGSNLKLAGQLLDGRTVRAFDTETFKQRKEKEDATIVSLFEEKLGLDTDSAQFLADSGFTTIEEIAVCEIEELEELLETDQAILLKEIAQKYLDSIIEKEIQIIKDSGIELKVLELEGVTNEIAIKLINKGILTLEALADLATDELRSVIPNKNKIAESLIMQARQICWFDNE